MPTIGLVLCPYQLHQGARGSGFACLGTSGPLSGDRGGNFKGVLKLAKNFHIYIHGDRNKIEQGVDEKGRKYYKIYYEQEA